MTLMPESDSSSVETISPMRCWLVRAGWRSFFTMLPISRNSTEKMASSHEMATIITM